MTVTPTGKLAEWLGYNTPIHVEENDVTQAQADLKGRVPHLTEEEQQQLAIYTVHTHPGFTTEAKTVAVQSDGKPPIAVGPTSEQMTAACKAALKDFKFDPVVVREPQKPEVIYVDRPVEVERVKVVEVEKQVVVTVEKPVIEYVEKQIVLTEPHTQVVEKQVVVEKPVIQIVDRVAHYPEQDKWKMPFRFVVIALIILFGLLPKAHCQDPSSGRDPASNKVIIRSGTTGTITPGALVAGACGSGTLAVSGATTAMTVTASPVTYPGDGSFWFGYVSSAGVVTLKICASVGMTPGATAYNIRVF